MEPTGYNGRSKICRCLGDRCCSSQKFDVKGGLSLWETMGLLGREEGQEAEEVTHRVLGPGHPETGGPCEGRTGPQV